MRLPLPAHYSRKEMLAPPLQRNARLRMHGLGFLRELEDECARLVFFDPQYRAVLDYQKYGNEGARQKGRSTLMAMPEKMILGFIREIERVLRPSGNMVLWVDKFAIGTGGHLEYVRHAGGMQLV